MERNPSLNQLSKAQISKFVKKNILVPNISNIITTLQNILLEMDELDIRHIGIIPGKFSQFIKELHLNYCYSSASKCASDLMPCFWSCRPGRDMARLDSHVYTDADCPIINLMFKYCHILNKNSEKDNLSMQKLLTNLSYGISRIYASFVQLAPKTNNQRIVSVYMGSDKSTERVGFHVNNNFWCAEFPLIRSLMRDGCVDDIVLKIVDCNIFSREISLKSDPIDLPLWRRNWHPLDGADTRISFVRPGMDESDWEKWRQAPPRPFITYDKLQKIINCWRRISGLGALFKSN